MNIEQFLENSFCYRLLQIYLTGITVISMIYPELTLAHTMRSFLEMIFKKQEHQ